MDEIQKKIKENAYIKSQINKTIEQYNRGEKKEAIVNLEQTIREINAKVIKQKLNIEIKRNSFNNIRKIYKEKDKELYEQFIEIYSQYEEINESGEINKTDFMYLLNQFIYMLETIIQKYGEIN